MRKCTSRLALIRLFPPVMVLIQISAIAAVLPDFAGEWSGTVTVTELGGKALAGSQQAAHECPVKLWVKPDGSVTADVNSSGTSATGLFPEHLLFTGTLSAASATVALTGSSVLSASSSGLPADTTIGHSLVLTLGTSDPGEVTGTYSASAPTTGASFTASGNANLRRALTWPEGRAPAVTPAPAKTVGRTGKAMPTTLASALSLVAEEPTINSLSPSRRILPTSSKARRYSLTHESSSSTVSASVETALLGQATAGADTGLSPSLNFPTCPQMWEPNGYVDAIAYTSNAVYIGGNFDYVGPRTGYGAPLDAVTAQPTPLYPRVNGAVHACIADGNGGWYIGGEFTEVGGLHHERIAHILADGTVDPWSIAIGASSPVYALALSGTTLYVGGDFTSIGNRPRNYIAALDTATGEVTAWDPNASLFVRALAVSDATVYVGGYFRSIGGASRNYIAAIDTTTGTATAWDPNADSLVWALAISDTTVYAGGYFTSVGGQGRNYIAALDATTGAAKTWNPGANDRVLALKALGATVYVGGQFTNIGGQVRNYIAALDAGTGTASAWNPNANAYTNTIAASGSTIYAGGMFSVIGGQKRNYIAALDAGTGAATAWDPSAGYSVNALAVSGTTVYAGGQFDSIGGVPRSCVAALDPTTGVATAWNPGASTTVYALAVSGSTVYVGGSFTSIGGQTRNRIAAVDLTTGNVTAWNPNSNGAVVALAVSGTTVYVGGTFLTIGGQARNRIAALDAVSGNATAWNPNADYPVWALAISGATVYAGGYYSNIGGQPRNAIAALDRTTGTATPWNPHANNSISALAISGSTVYAGGEFTTMGGTARNHVVALDSATGTATAWNPDANNRVSALAISDTTVYAGGFFSGVGGQERSYIAALNPTTGAATAWNPGANGAISALAVSGTTLYVGGHFTTIGGEDQRNFAALTDSFAYYHTEITRLVTRAQTYQSTFTSTGYDYAGATTQFTKAYIDPADRTPKVDLEDAVALGLGALTAYPEDSVFRENTVGALSLYLDGCALVGNERLQEMLRLKGRWVATPAPGHWERRDLSSEVTCATAAAASYRDGILLFNRTLGSSSGWDVLSGLSSEEKVELTDRYALLVGRWMQASREKLSRQFQRDYRSVLDDALLAQWSAAKVAILDELQVVLAQAQVSETLLGTLCPDAGTLATELAQIRSETESVLGLVRTLNAGLNPLGYSELEVPWQYRIDKPGSNFDQVYLKLTDSLDDVKTQEVEAAQSTAAFEGTRTQLREKLFAQYQSTSLLIGEANQICGGSATTYEDIPWDGPWSVSSTSGGRIVSALKSMKTQQDRLAAVIQKMKDHQVRVNDLKELIRQEAQVTALQVQLVLEGGQAVTASAMGLDADADIPEYAEQKVTGHTLFGLHYDDYKTVLVANHNVQGMVDAFLSDLGKPNATPGVFMAEFKTQLDEVSKWFDGEGSNEQGQSTMVQALQGATIVAIQGWHSQKQLEQQIKDEYLLLAEAMAEYVVELDALDVLATDLQGLMERKEYLRSQLMESMRRYDQMNAGSGQDLIYYRLLRNDSERRAALWYRAAQTQAWMLVRALEQEFCLERYRDTVNNVSRDSLYTKRTADELKNFAGWLNTVRGSYLPPQPATPLTVSLKDDILKCAAGNPHPLTGDIIQVGDRPDPLNPAVRISYADLAFREYVVANVQSNKTASNTRGILKVVFPLSLTARGVGEDTQVPTVNRWDVELYSLGIAVVGDSTGGSLGNGPLKIYLVPRGPSEALAEDGSLVQYLLGDFMYPYPYINDGGGDDRYQMNYLNWEGEKQANVDLVSGGASFVGTDVRLRGYHVANPRWELLMPLNEAGNNSITNNLGGLADMEITFSYTYRNMDVKKALQN